MNDLNRSRNLSARRLACCLRLPVALPVLTAVLVLAIPVAAQAQFNYTVTNQTVTITGYTGFSGVVNIPTNINGLLVTAIGDNVFNGDINLTSVTVPNSVTSIGYAAFASCYGLTSVTIGNSVTNIRDRTFEQCINLTSVTIPNGVTSLGVSAFSGCFSLTNITLGTGVTSIGDYAFYNSGLTNIIVDPLNPVFSSVGGVLFNHSQTTLVEYPFGRLGNYTIPNSVTTIGANAFANCGGLTNVTIPNSVTSIGDSAFAGCYGLTDVTIPNSVISLGDSAFSASSLTNITLGSGLTSIGIAAFSARGKGPYYGCPLINVTIPNSVTNIGNFAFAGCSSLTNITVDPLNSAYSSVDGVLFNHDRTTLVQYPGGKVGGYTIPKSVTNIADYAFTQCYSLTSLYFQGNAPSLGGIDVFYNDFNNPTIYYLSGTTGWGPTFSGNPTALWLPLVQATDTSFGVKTNQFGFNIIWADGTSVVVEASPSLSNPVWSPVATNNLVGGSFYFSDPQWRSYPARFYRIRSQ